MATKEKQRLPFYSFHKLWGYNAYYNFVLGPRGRGKTYGAVDKAIKNFINKGEQFIYVRRYTKELAVSRDTFFEAIKHTFPKWDFKVAGNAAYIAPASTRDDKKRPWELMGYFVALSTAANQKSVSYPRVTLIIYDEFVIQKGNVQYLNNEAVKFNEFYSTVDRYIGKTRVLFLANSVSIMNPYFLYYDIDVKPGQEWMRLYEGFICVHFDKAEAFADEVFKTPFGKFIQQTKYANYAVSNQFADNDLELIQKKTSESSYQFTIETRAGTFSLWLNFEHRIWYAQQKRPEQESLYTLIPENMTVEKTLLTKTDPVMMIPKTAFKQGRLLFDSPKSRNAFRELFK